ncbi:arylsulfatase [Haloferula sp. BvORR071]|uniref:arylsulfatase B n=1 Tax=Haloferula sp. BvORR071 TaxID=1396141 RepID=UPI0006982125|nr:arylsulfatase [Haloferula sp. BvORR071]
MTRPSSLRLFATAVLTVLVSSLASAEETPPADPKRPNIVFFLIDDLGYADCGFNGGKQIKTPNIDKLAREGSILDSLYVQPVCSPTRAALMTGRYPTHTGVYTIVRPHAKWGLPLAERTLANALHDAGYETAITGKWHLGEFEPAYLPTARGFDHQYGHYFGAIDYFTHMRDGSHDWYRDGKELKEEGYSTHLVAREACRLIEGKDKAKPLFLYVPFNGVHAPMQVPQDYLKPYPYLKGPRQKLAGMLSAVDEAVGKVVASLEKAGLRGDTLIVFSSDNGGPAPGDNSPLRARKGTIYEGGVRACGFLNWPDHVPAGAHVKAPMHAVDWYPTFLKLAGGSLEQKLPLDGCDVWPMLTQGATSPHEAILLAGSPGRVALRMGDWKLLTNASEVDSEESSDDGEKPAAKESFELYDLANDIGEKTNLADKESERVAQMRTKLAEMLKNAVPPGAPKQGPRK